MRDYTHSLLVRLTAEEHARLKAMSEETGAAMAWIVRKALDEYFDAGLADPFHACHVR